MKLKGKITGFRNYLAISKKLAEVKNKSRVKILSKNIWSRLLLSISPTFFRPYFVVYGFSEKKYFARNTPACSRLFNDFQIVGE